MPLTLLLWFATVCPAGKHTASDGQTNCIECRAGKYASSPFSATACIDCAAGKHLASTGNDAETDCVACAAGADACPALPQRQCLCLHHDGPCSFDYIRMHLYICICALSSYDTCVSICYHPRTVSPPACPSTSWSNSCGPRATGSCCRAGGILAQRKRCLLPFGAHLSLSVQASTLHLLDLILVRSCAQAPRHQPHLVRWLFRGLRQDTNHESLLMWQTQILVAAMSTFLQLSQAHNPWAPGSWNQGVRTVIVA